MGNQPGANWILKDVVGNDLKCPTLSLSFCKHMVERLSLPRGGSQSRAEMLAEKFNGDTLVGTTLIEAKPEQMEMIGHEHKGRADERIAGARMEENMLPGVVKPGCQPTDGAIFYRQGPMNERSATVVFGSKAGKVALGHSLTLAATRGSCHWASLRKSSW